MANPLFNALFGGSPMTGNAAAQSHGMSGQAGPYSMQEALSQLQSNPAEFIRQAGYNVPNELANNPQAAAMHIIQSGQAKGPVMQRIQPMLNMLMGRR